MAIRKVEAPKVSKNKDVTAQAPAAAPDAAVLRPLTDLIDRALRDGNFSQNEARQLEAQISEHPGLKGPVAAHLRAALERAQAQGEPISISEMALSQVSRSLGLDFKELFFRRQAQSQVAQHDVGAGLQKQAKTVADEHSADKQRAASDTRLAHQKAILDGRNGVVDRPIGGSKGAAYDAALVLAQHVEGKLDEKLSPEARAAKDVLREPLVRTSSQVLTEVTKNPETMKSLGQLSSTLGTPAFKETLGAACSAVGKDIVNATGCAAVNVDAVQAVVAGASSSAGKLVALSKTLGSPAVEAAVAKHAPRAAESVAAVGAKLTQGARVAGDAAKVAGTAAKTAQAATAATAAATSAATSAAAGAAQAAGATAQVAGATAQTAGQAVPVVGQALGVVTTGMAAAEFVGTCRNTPREWKRILSAGLNVVGQAVGIFIPFVGAAATASKLAADAAMNAHDRKQGKEPPADFQLRELAPHLTNASGLASTFLDSAGHSDAATKLRAYSQKLEAVADKGLSSAELAALKPAEREAMLQTLAACQGEAEKLALDETGTPNEAAAVLLGEAYRGLMATWRKSKNVDQAENPDAERKKLAGEAMEAAAKASTASALIDAASVPTRV